MSGQEVVEEGYYAIGPLANIHTLINEVVDLLLRSMMTSFPMQLASQKDDLLGVGWPHNRRQRSHISLALESKWGQAVGGYVVCGPK